MVSSPHEAMHRIFREDPELFARLLPRAGIAFPQHTAIEPLDTDFTELKPLERRVDSFFRVRVADEEGGFVLAVEAQSEPDSNKHRSWPYYLAYMYAKYRLPPFLVVVCKDKATASWAAEPIRVCHGFHTSMLVFPLVIGPGNLSAITDPDEAAKDVPVAVFSALAHAKDPGLPAILEALSSAVAEQRAGAGGNAGAEPVDWAEFVEIGLGDGPGREYWRHLMATYRPNFPGSNTIVEESWLKGRDEGKAQGHAEGKAQGHAEGEARGRAEDILHILGMRGIEVSASVRERVTACTDLEALRTWLDRSLTATSGEELFAEE
ncbi:hypothetical protein ACWD4G_39160 [Streptomyces sp. NPDC002643]